DDRGGQRDADADAMHDVTPFRRRPEYVVTISTLKCARKPRPGRGAPGDAARTSGRLSRQSTVKSRKDNSARVSCGNAGAELCFDFRLSTVDRRLLLRPVPADRPQRAPLALRVVAPRGARAADAEMREREVEAHRVAGVE